MHVLENTFPRLIAHPIALEASFCAAAREAKAMLSSSVTGPIEGELKGISKALEQYLLGKDNSNEEQLFYSL